MVFKQLIYKEVFSEPTNYVVRKIRNLKVVYSTFDTVKDCLAKTGKEQTQKTMFVKIS